MNANARTNVGILLLRIGVGLVLLYYGSQKVLGVFGGFGPQRTIDVFQHMMGIPPPLTILGMAGEFLGGLGIIVGALTSVAAFGAACTMAVATYENCKEPGIFETILHGGGDPSKPFFTGALFFGAVAIMIMGGGAYSVDAKLFGKKRGRR